MLKNAVINLQCFEHLSMSIAIRDVSSMCTGSAQTDNDILLASMATTTTKYSLFLFLTFSLELFFAASAIPPRDDGIWTERAKIAISHLNDKWYSRLLKQWMKNDNHSALGVWHTWNGLEMLADFVNYTGDSTFDAVMIDIATNGPLQQSTINNGYNDDALWCGIALVKVNRRTPSVFLVNGAKEIFNKLVTMWDAQCAGGVYWSTRKTYKNAITNELFLVLATDLFEITGQQVYLDWANTEYNWLIASGMLNSQFLFNDGLADNCTNNQQNTWTYNQGVILGGLVNLARFQPQNATMYFNLADQIARSVIARLTLNSSEGNPILHEKVVDGEDGEQFKGIFMRYLGQLMMSSPSAENAAFYARFLLNNADYVWQNCRNELNEVSAVWIGERHDPPWYDAIAQISGADLLNAAAAAEKVMKRLQEKSDPR